jgi:hypothetical protein
MGLLGGGANAAAAAINNLNSTTGSYAFNASQVTSALQNTMKGYMGDVWKQADNIMSEQYQAQIDGINKAGQARQKGFEAQGKAMQRAQKDETDALKASQDARSKAIDDQIKVFRTPHRLRKTLFRRRSTRRTSRTLFVRSFSTARRLALSVLLRCRTTALISMLR